jgi:isopenicillin N synthase-like dioxygenase
VRRLASSPCGPYHHLALTIEPMAARLISSCRAVHNVGFFYVTDFGISQEDVDEQFAIGKEVRLAVDRLAVVGRRFRSSLLTLAHACPQVFDLPFEERAKYAADHANGGYSAP